MDGDEILRQLRTHAPLDGVVRIHTFKGSFEGSTREITIEVRSSEDENGTGRYLLHAVNEEGKRVAGSASHDSLERAITQFPWYALGVEEE